MVMRPQQPLALFMSYSQKDEAFKQEFEDYLVNFQQAQLISGWAERQVQPGIDWSQVIDARLATAQIFLLFLSPSMLSSGYCSGAEFREAWQRRNAGDVHMIPISLHFVDLTGHSLGSIQHIPRGAKPVSSWPRRSEAWAAIYQDIRRVIQHYQSNH
ncbi:hypothetical protein KDW_41210 [Dictyobacter vulcani]|uniref:TIR domain-containing protein n=1 Tax=Dictyobacter vulcani TaxID=2607529 RepID=A0A5J4KV35_9CHLR|nr:toll/interleukin-1 receptor domain-containing protein [Dictyobacter vulcani]GER89959.1 hypothetical protein KDW_41210 [Dictyobacter vulcani]